MFDLVEGVLGNNFSLKEADEMVEISIDATYNKESLKFFVEMCANWIVPGKHLHIKKIHAEREDLKIHLKAEILPRNEEERLQILENYTILEEEIKLGASSSYHAKKILELKGLLLEEKDALVQSFIQDRVFKFVNHFDSDLFSLMQKYLVMVREDYKQARSYELLSRVICNAYLILDNLKNFTEISPNQRHFYLKLIPVQAQTPFGKKMVLGSFVAMNFLKENEMLEDKHLIRAVKKHFPDARLIEGSYFFQREDDTLIFYVEFEKEDSFSSSEISFLKSELKDEVKASIETLVSPIFMPRNEEEVMKYVVTLSKQVTMLKDLPQIVILFQEQTNDALLFTLLVVRPLLNESANIHRVLEMGEQFLKNNYIFSDAIDYRIEKVRHAGFIRKKVYKEASQIRIALKKKDFMRLDFVVDLYKARQVIVSWIESYLGNVRDYNGGMISKQMEKFLEFQEKYLHKGFKEEKRLSNFFHSLYPIELRVSTSVIALQKLYDLMVKWVENRDSFILHEDDLALYLCTSEKIEVLESVESLKIPSIRLLQLRLTLDGKAIIGYIFFSEDALEKDRFLSATGCSLSKF
jgi:hypothetical protein